MTGIILVPWWHYGFDFKLIENSLSVYLWIKGYFCKWNTEQILGKTLSRDICMRLAPVAFNTGCVAFCTARGPWRAGIAIQPRPAWRAAVTPCCQPTWQLRLVSDRDDLIVPFRELLQGIYMLAETQYLTQWGWLHLVGLH